MVSWKIVSSSSSRFTIILFSSKFSVNFYKNNKHAANLKKKDIEKIALQIYSKLPKFPFNSFNSQKYFVQFCTHLFKDLKDLSPVLLTKYLT